MKTQDVLRGWKTILEGRAPFLSVEITRECPLTCPGCYAYGDAHLGGDVVLRQVSDFKGEELISRFLALVDEYQPLHLSIVGGEPLVRFRELQTIVPAVASRGIHIQLVTSAVRAIPRDWAEVPRMTIVVSIDGLPAEHDVRRKPATYERILKNIEGSRITVHCTVTRQMTERRGYLEEFVEFWSPRPEVDKIWISLFTPQIGERSYEIIPPDARHEVLEELRELNRRFPKLAMPETVIQEFANPPADPHHCIFAKTTRTITADLKNRVTPCQFGGNPDCSQCGCIASAGLNAIGNHRLFGAVRLGWIYDKSLRFGQRVAAIRNGMTRTRSAPIPADGVHSHTD